MGDRIPLSEVIDEIRAELVAAAARAAAQDVHFAVGPVQIELQVGVTKTADAKGGVKLWVVDLGAGGSVSHAAVQKVTVNLEAPLDRAGRRVLVTDELEERP
ncbi:hypothetical protein OG948_33565 [Embleya sp. NBC_00888]|uniref:trypco2 family protein n=1 Tax=Embleya sp. NBC_00888 TaxID=2975960 RepID=UPI003870B1C4|nr:hypothetical protein OG948_33565 [Embleya sp. NBC_00888]